jgi:hypothetical protein
MMQRHGAIRRFPAHIPIGACGGRRQPFTVSEDLPYVRAEPPVPAVSRGGDVAHRCRGRVPIPQPPPFGRRLHGWDVSPRWWPTPPRAEVLWDRRCPAAISMCGRVRSKGGLPVRLASRPPPCVSAPGARRSVGSVQRDSSHALLGRQALAQGNMPAPGRLASSSGAAMAAGFRWLAPRIWTSRVQGLPLTR